MDLAPFPGYFGGAPANDGIILRVVPDDMMRGLELRKGAVDLVVNDLPPDVIAQLARDDEVQVAESPGTDYPYIGFNLRDPVLSDMRVRHAIGFAIDRQAIVDYLRRGLARPAVGILPPGRGPSSPTCSSSHSIAIARALLDEAGYPDPDGDGPAPRLRLTLKVSTNEFIRLQAAVIQQDLRQVGIELDVRSLRVRHALRGRAARATSSCSRCSGWAVSDPDILRRVFHSQQVPPAGFNRGLYSNPEVDRLIDEATVAMDPAERGRLYREAQRLIAEDAPYISLWYKTNVAVYRKGLEGVRLSPSAEFTFLKNVSKRNHEGTN